MYMYYLAKILACLKILVYPYISMCMNIHFTAILTKGDNIGDFQVLFASLEGIFLPKRGRLFTHYILVDSSTVMCWTSPFVILGVFGLFCLFCFIFNGESC